MPNVSVPATPPATPARVVLPAGTRLSRIHGIEFAVTAFNPNPADRHWGGGRFDGTDDDPYPFLYAGSDDEIAVCEALLRDLPLEPESGRFLPLAAVAGKALGRLVVKEDIALVGLRTGKELARLGQGDNWLSSAPAAEYGFTRRWGHAIRAWAPWAQGLVWPSRREPAKLAYVFFGDRFAPGQACLEGLAHEVLPSGQSRLDVDPGRAYLQTILVEYRVALAPRARPQAPTTRLRPSRLAR